MDMFPVAQLVQKFAEMCIRMTVHAALGLLFVDGTKHILQHAMSSAMQAILRPCTLSSQGGQNTVWFRHQLCCANRDAHMPGSVDRQGSNLPCKASWLY